MGTVTVMVLSAGLLALGFHRLRSYQPCSFCEIQERHCCHHWPSQTSPTNFVHSCNNMALL